eukprot:gene13830-16307_t
MWKSAASVVGSAGGSTVAKTVGSQYLPDSSKMVLAGRYGGIATGARILIIFFKHWIVGPICIAEGAFMLLLEIFLPLLAKVPALAVVFDYKIRGPIFCIVPFFTVFTIAPALGCIFTGVVYALLGYIRGESAQFPTNDQKNAEEGNSKSRKTPLSSQVTPPHVATVKPSASMVVNPTVDNKMDLFKFEADTNHPAPSSKYDFVKVKVRLEDHYYVLSRFLISRVLNVTKVDAADSVKISLELKKRLVDQGRLSLTQAELEIELFTLLQAYGYGNEYIERYRMTTQFHHQRVPLIILISGPKCIGKSWLATQLAERLNMSTVLQTTLVQDLMHAIIKEFNPNSASANIFGMPSDPPIVFKRHNSGEELIAEFKKECTMIRHGVDTDIEKCFDEAPTTTTTATPSSLSTAGIINSLKKPKTKGIIIPFVLSIKENDHRLMVENWLSCSPTDAEYAKKAFGNDAKVQTSKVVENLQTIQKYLCTGVPPFQLVEVNAHSYLDTLDVLHSAVLKRINDAYSGHVKGFEYE